MEGEKQSGSSIASDLFGAKVSSAADSSSGIFRQIFYPPATASRGESLNLSEALKKSGSMSEVQSVESGVSNNHPQSGHEHSRSAKGNDFLRYYKEQKTLPFHYSSSIYYGGQDDYSPPQSVQSPANTLFTKETEENDKGLASRGNWWQGSLYY